MRNVQKATPAHRDQLLHAGAQRKRQAQAEERHHIRRDKDEAADFLLQIVLTARQGATSSKC